MIIRALDCAFIALIFAGLLPASRADLFNVPAFTPATWPGKVPANQMGKIRERRNQLAEAERRHDDLAIGRIKSELIELYGSFAGTPEESPVYSGPIDASAPDRKRAIALWQDSVRRHAGRFGWESAAKLETSPGAGGRAPRLRVSEREIRGLLNAYEAGLPGGEEDLRMATRGLDYLVLAQSSSGVFGYPYEPNGPGLKKEFSAAAERGRSEGKTTIERAWIVDDQGEGGLQFDNGVCGVTLIRGYRLTHKPSYLEAALRAGRWAETIPIAPNFNYNGFSGALFSELYRATGERRWLSAAIDRMRYGVLPGEMSNGRWFDQHNAKIQYHSILMWETGEYWLALRRAADPSAAEVERAWRLGLDNLAEEVGKLGTANAVEALQLDAFCEALAVLGPRENWVRAANIVENCETGPFGQIFPSRREIMPPGVSEWLLYASHPERLAGNAAGGTENPRFGGQVADAGPLQRLHSAGIGNAASDAFLVPIPTYPARKL